MIKVALTGGIGGGKTTISNIFKEQGVPVFNSDLCAKDAEKDPDILESFQRILGYDIINNGVVDREKMRNIVFTNKDKLKGINNVVIPFVKRKFDEFCCEANSSYVMLESAIIFEVGVETNFDKIITVYADEIIRIERTIKRDNLTAIEVKNKINNQLSDDDKIKRSDYIIYNTNNLDNNIHQLMLQIKAIDKAIKFDILSNVIKTLKS